MMNEVAASGFKVRIPQGKYEVLDENDDVLYSGDDWNTARKVFESYKGSEWWEFLNGKRLIKWKTVEKVR